MDDDKIQEIEKRGYNATNLIAFCAGIDSGYIYEKKEGWHKSIMRVNPNSKKEKREKGKSRITQTSSVMLQCIACGKTIYSSICPHCSHDNYEILRIRGVPRKEESK